jgi:hypothetical protein
MYMSSSIIGIPSLDLGFRSVENGYAGVYHSIYDDYKWMDTFGYRHCVASLPLLLTFSYHLAYISPLSIVIEHLSIMAPLLN